MRKHVQPVGQTVEPALGILARGLGVASVLAFCACAVVPGEPAVGGPTLPVERVEPSARPATAELPREVRADEVRGKATWYGERHHGRTTASGEPFDMHAMTAAHKTLPFNTVVRVVETSSRRSVVVRINDRGPYREGRVIDLSFAAATELGIVSRGVAPVQVEILEWGDGVRVKRKKAKG